MTNIALARRILDQCAAWGVRTFCISPGGRNAPFVECLHKLSGVEILSFFDERAAGFFALGRAQNEERPVAVITTSGTAASELLSPLIEAHYTQTPLLAITCDRPAKYRGSGAPQVIEQVGLYGSYVEACFDLSVSSAVDLQWQQRRSLHLNVCFSEPLIDEPIREGTYRPQDPPGQKFVSAPKAMAMPDWHKFSRPLAIVGPLSGRESESLKVILEGWNCPIYFEGPSGLREVQSLQNTRISNEPYLRRLLREGRFDLLLRIGGVPTARLWRDVDEWQIPVVSVSHREFAGHPAAQLVLETTPGEFHNLPVELRHPDLSELKGRDQEFTAAVRTLIEKYPACEMAFFAKLIDSIKAGTDVYVGNSLPIREWDLLSEPSQLCRVLCNRGANGIDGQLAAALGHTNAHSEMAIVLGDLTCLYDASSLSLRGQLPGRKVNLYVVNNRGGQIFARLFKSPLFINAQSVSFEFLAKTFHWNYRLWNDPAKEVTKAADFTMIEVVPDIEQSEKFWDDYDGLWK